MNACIHIKYTPYFIRDNILRLLPLSVYYPFKHINEVILVNIIQIIQEKEDGPLYKFYEVILDLGANNQFYNELTLAKDLTLFAPSNEAWAEHSVQNIIRYV